MSFKAGDKVKCVDNNCVHLQLTLGREYEIVESYTETVSVYNDANVLAKHYSDRFELVKPEPKAPVSFKTQAEIYQALLDGKILEHVPTYWRVKLIDGHLVNPSDLSPALMTFEVPSDWTIYEGAPVAEPEKIEVYQWRMYDTERKRYLIESFLYTKEEVKNNPRYTNHEPHAGPFYVTKPKDVK